MVIQMKIIRDGYIYRMTAKRFKCGWCGCIFEMGKNEYAEDDSIEGKNCFAVCPQCGDEVPWAGEKDLEKWDKFDKTT